MGEIPLLKSYIVEFLCGWLWFVQLLLLQQTWSHPSSAFHFISFRFRNCIWLFEKELKFFKNLFDHRSIV